MALLVQIALIGIALVMIYLFKEMLVILFFQPKQNSYDGETDDDGLFHGKGELNLVNGDEYKGTFKHGYIHGQGEYAFGEDSGNGVYFGSFKMGEYCGKGREIYPDSSAYEGEFEKALRHGRGFMQYKDGCTYDGEWVAGKKHGKGCLTYPDSEAFTGMFAQGFRHGPGVLKLRDVTIEGVWDRGELASITRETPHEAKAKPTPVAADVTKKSMFAVKAQDSLSALPRNRRAKKSPKAVSS